MTNKTNVDQMLNRWEALQEERKQAVAADEVCGEFPALPIEDKEEFKAQVALLRQFDGIFGGSTDQTLPAMDSIGEFCEGRYQVETLYDQGGLGELYLARDRELQRVVIVKGIQVDRSRDQSSQQQFVNEAVITGQLEHPGVVPVYGFGRDQQGRPYYAMRMIRGMTLGEAIKNHHQTTQDAQVQKSLGRMLRDFLSVCQTIHFAHSRGIIHRDIKPANIMLGPFGEVLVVDWGLAKVIAATVGQPISDSSLHDPIVAPEPALSRQDIVKGSPCYMSPEQAAAKHSEVGPTSDIYSLGATLYELLTGQIPFLGNSSAEVIEQVKSGRIRPPRQVNPGVPLALEAICLKAMHKEPANRYQTAAELAKDIENYLDDQPVSTYTEPLFDQVRRFARRHRALVSTAIGALLVSLIGFAIATPILTAALRDSRLARQAESEARDAESQRANELAHALYRNQFQEAVAWQSLDSQRSRRLLNASDADLRGVEWSLLNAQLDSRARLIAVPSLQHYERVSRFTLSPDRSLAAVIGHPDHLAVHEVVSGKVVWHPDVGWADGNSEQAIISPDNRFLAVMVPTHLEETLYARTTVIVLDLSTKSELWRKSWEHTEQRESNVLAWDTEGNQPVRRTRTTRERIEYWNSMAFSEQSGSLTFVRSQLEQNSMTLVFDQYDSATGERLASESSDPMTIYRDMTLSTDGRWLAVPNQEWLQILDTTSGEIVSQWKHDQPIISTQVGARLPVRKFSSDGKLFAMLDPQLHLRNQSNSPISLNKPVVRVWDTQTGDLIQTLRLHDAFPDVNFIEYLPDNNRLILVGHEQVEIWNVTEGERLQKMLLPPQKRFELPIDPKTIMGIELISDHQIWCLIEDGSVSELDLESTPSIKRWNSPDVAKKLALAGDNSSLVVLQDRNGRIVVANADTNETIREVGMETTDVSQMDASFAVDTKCELLAVVNSSGLRVEELQTGLLRFEVESIEWQKSRSETVVATVHGPVAFSKDGTTLFIAASDDSLPTVDPAPYPPMPNPNHWIVAIDVQTGREQYRLLASVGKGSEIMQLVPCPSGPFLAVAYGSGSAIYGNPLDLFDLEKKQQLTRDLIKPILELPSQVLGPIAFSPDGKWLAVTIRPATALFETEPVGPHQVFVFETTTWSKVVALETQSSQTQNFSAILFSPDSRRLMTTSLDGFMRVWDRETGQLMWTSPQAIHPILSAVLSPDGSKLCVFRGPSEVGQNRGGQFEVWNLIEQH